MTLISLDNIHSLSNSGWEYSIGLECHFQIFVITQGQNFPLDSAKST